MFPYKYRFVDTYYLVNYAVILSYFVVRTYLITPESPLVSKEKSWVGLTRELEIFIVMMIIQLKNLRKKKDIDNIIQSFVFALKIVVISLVFQMDKKVAAMYSVCYIFIFLLFSPPKFDGPSNVIDYSDNSFRTIVLEDTTSMQYYVMFDASWASGLEYVKTIFAEISTKYVDDRAIFLHVDLTNQNDLAKELNINIQGYAGEIPVFIKFQKGKEVSRVPSLSNKPRVKSYQWSEDILCEAFGVKKIKVE